MFKIYSVFQPKSALEKMAMCAAKGTASKSASECPWLSKLNGINSVPAFLGGTGALPPELEPFSTRADAFIPVSIKNQSVQHFRFLGLLIVFILNCAMSFNRDDIDQHCAI